MNQGASLVRMIEHLEADIIINVAEHRVAYKGSLDFKNVLNKNFLLTKLLSFVLQFGFLSSRINLKMNHYY